MTQAQRKASTNGNGSAEAVIQPVLNKEFPSGSTPAWFVDAYKLESVKEVATARAALGQTSKGSQLTDLEAFDINNYFMLTIHHKMEPEQAIAEINKGKNNAAAASTPASSEAIAPTGQGQGQQLNAPPPSQHAYNPSTTENMALKATEHLANAGQVQSAYTGIDLGHSMAAQTQRYAVFTYFDDLVKMADKMPETFQQIRGVIRESGKGVALPQVALPKISLPGSSQPALAAGTVALPPGEEEQQEVALPLVNDESMLHPLPPQTSGAFW